MLYIHPTLIKLNARDHGRQSTGSVRVKLTPSEKKSVLNVFMDHNNFYNDYAEELYYEHNDKIGNDKVKYKTAKIISDINIKIPDWMQTKNDLYESYLLRHNHVVVTTGDKINKLHGNRIADEYIDRYFIDYGVSAPRHTPSTNLWEVS
jgi:hypothetical protein